MKTTLFILLFSIALIFTACMTSQTSSTNIVMLRDVTGANPVLPNADAIIKLYGFDTNQWNGGYFTFSDISQVSFNPTEQVKISASNKWRSNEFQREAEIKAFQKSLSEIISRTEQTPAGKNNSSVYVPVANELNRLSKSKSERRILVLYSDLMEHTSVLSFYKKRTLAEIKTNPETIRKSFEELETLQNLSGIEVFLIYQPTDTYSDRIFTIVSAFYKKILEDKGAIVNISANINL